MAQVLQDLGFQPVGPAQAHEAGGKPLGELTLGGVVGGERAAGRGKERIHHRQILAHEQVEPLGPQAMAEIVQR
jgi:hypothetical protein